MPQSRLFLVTPSELSAAAALACLDGEAASLLISDGPLQAEQAMALTAPAQAKGIAVLIEYDVELARSAGADGVMTGGALNSWQAARAALGAGAIVGARCSTRHQAMEIADAGADFIAFNKRELVDWWTAISQVPCVALMPGDDVPEAEFVVPSVTMWQAGDGT